MRYRVAALPGAVGKLCELLATIRGIDAVVIGGSRAAGMADIASDWDIGLYYRGDINLRPLLDYGEVHRVLGPNHERRSMAEHPRNEGRRVVARSRHCSLLGGSSAARAV